MFNYFPNFNVPPPSLPQNRRIEETVDMKIERFLTGHRLEATKDASVPKLRLFDVNQRMENVTQLKNHLERLYDDLKLNVNQLSEEQWLLKTSEIEKIQQQLNVDTIFLHENLRKIQILIKKRQNKRKSRKTRKIKWRESQKQEVADRQRKHQEIDQNLKQLQDKLNSEKQANLEREETQTTLASVNKRIRETKEKLELFDSLIKLRQIRKQQTQRPERDTNEESFIEEISRMRTLWSLALDQLLDEERQLQDYLHEKFKSQQTIEQQWNEVLFGPSITGKKIDHPMLRAEKHLETFLNIRQEWDACLHPSGSSIPCFWVLPNKSIESWQLYQNK